MTQALFTSMTGLNAGTNQLTVVSDNVANMNTTAYKTSRVDFQDIWYQTKSGGTNSTRSSGGTNPYQIGVGVKTAAITKNMDASSINTTGRSEDMAIQGDGWFTVVNSDGKVLYTRDGNFSLDEEGYVCTSNGSKVIGMDLMESTTCSNIPLKIPHAITVTEFPTEKGILEKITADELNNCDIASGTITFKSGNKIYSVNLSEEDIRKPLGEMLTSIMGANATEVDEHGNVVKDAGGNPITAAMGDFFTSMEVNNDGGITITPKVAVEFVGQGTSSFANQLGLLSQGSTNQPINSKQLNISATITDCVDVTAKNSHIKDDWSIGVDGLATVTYSDGSSLSVKMNEDGNTYFSYVNANGVEINSAVNTSPNEESLYVNPNVLVKANMQVQLAKVVNNNGMVATGNNCYEKGVNAGDVIYTTANHNGVGGIATGALESSNVDLAQQFSNMILAQRLVQANSQIFSGANSMLETLVYLGRS